MVTVLGEAASRQIDTNNPFQLSIVKHQNELETYMENDIETLLTSLSDCLPTNVQKDISEMKEKNAKSKTLFETLLKDDSKAQVFYNIFIAMDKIQAAKLLEQAAQASGKSLCEISDGPTNTDDKKGMLLPT